MELQVTLRPQKTGMWCWAASGQMVMEYLGKSVEQCIQANYRLHRSDCCNSPTPDECVSGGWPEFERYGFQFKRTNGTPLTWNQLRSQLAAKKVGEPCSFTPFAFSWRWIGNGGHMMVATGYTTTPDGKNYVHVNDPWEPNIGATRTILYEVYDQLPGDHTHWDDFYDIR
ncbi:hypothetical protein XI07_16055 [Bradyrhizobium sp. CCBAU 11445]|nr:hypothetical protein [Bradyrhizobium sp. CCBAU 25360]MDA9483492.1 hypothetical protein [Bradyrhizobium sp. CCBAU 11445]